MAGSVFQAFNYEIAELSFMGEPINKNYVKYIIIESLYESRTVATMYLSMHIPPTLYNAILEAEKSDEGRISITIRPKNMYSETSIGTDYISGNFSYIMPSSNPDYSLSLSNANMADNYRSLTISLINTELLDKLKSSLVGTYNKIDIQDLLRIALEHFENVVVQPPTVEDLKKIETIVIPPVNSMKRMIDFIFNVKPFYNTGYTFFADFNRMYLCAHDSETTSAIGAINTVIFHVTPVTDTATYMQGLVPGTNTRGNFIDGGIYHVYLNPSEIALIPNKGMDMISDQIMSVEESGKVTDPIKLDYGVLGQSSDHEFAKLAMRRGANVNLYANIMNSNTVSLEVKKAHLNGAIITPDKVITVSFELSGEKADFNERYSGDYYLTSKVETIRNNSGTFAVTSVIGMKKIGNLLTVADTSKVSSSSSLTGEGSRGYHSYKLGSKASQTAKSAQNHSSTQSTQSRISNSTSVTYSAPNPYGLKSNSFTGSKYIDTKSSGAVNLLEPHINEKRL